VCDLETSRIGAPYIYDLSNLRVNIQNWVDDILRNNLFIISNLIHKSLVRLHKLHYIKLIYMFRAHSVHQQEVNDVNCTYAASGIVTLCKWLSCATAKEGLLLYWCSLVLTVWSRRFCCTRWTNCFCTILFWSSCTGISVLLV
jgi:hypothetical protein